MKRKLFGALMMLTFASAAFAQKAKPLTINFKAQDTSVNEVEIQFAETDTVIPMTIIGDPEAASKQTQGTVTLNLTKPTYGMVTYRWKRTIVYLEPGKNFDIAYDLTPAALTATVTSKKSKINPYLASGELKGPVMGDFGKDASEILPILEEYLNNNYKLIDSKKLDKTFVAKEKQRVEYWIYGFLAQYAQQKPCDQPVYDKLQELAERNEEWYTETSDYTNFMYSAITALALRDMDIDNSQASQTKAVTAVLEYAVAHVKNKSALDYIIGINAVQHITNNGNEGGERIKEIFEANVTDPEIVTAFNAAWANGAVLSKGKPSPSFAFEDINGKTVTLESLRGRYVYIDVWATWCVPCRGEIPALQKLEETFDGFNIAFVSLSCDRDKAKWESTVKEGNMGGIQLWGGEDNEFLQKYRINGIPRFIFLDPEGRIINPDMTRPSDPTTIEALGMIAMPME